MTKARDLSKLLSTANGKIAGANLDVSFENISDTGTAGTKVASGTTAQRGSTAGQIRFNSQTGLAEYYTGTDFKVIDSPPTVTVVSPLEVESDVGGNITFTITGSNFQSGATVKFIGSDATEITASTTTVTNSTTISAVIARSSFVNAKEPYDVKVINGSGLSGVLDNQISVDVSPAWSTASGTLATISDVATGTHATVSATDADGDTVSYSETGGTVLTTAGLTLNSSTGAISGNPTDVGSSTTYNFNLRASAGGINVDRAFNIIVNPALDGSSSARAGTNALAIKNLTGTTTDGLYWINLSSGAKQMYCDMNTDGGGWMLTYQIDADGQNSCGNGTWDFPILDNGGSVSPQSRTTLHGNGGYTGFSKTLRQEVWSISNSQIRCETRNNSSTTILCDFKLNSLHNDTSNMIAHGARGFSSAGGNYSNSNLGSIATIISSSTGLTGNQNVYSLGAYGCNCCESYHVGGDWSTGSPAVMIFGDGVLAASVGTVIAGDTANFYIK